VWVHTEILYIAHESITLSAIAYNSLAASTMGCIAHLASPPLGPRRVEVCALNRVLHLAANSLSLPSIHHLFKVINRNLISLPQYMHACMIKAARCTVSGNDSLHRMLTEVRFMHQYVPPLPDTVARPLGWDSVALLGIFLELSITSMSLLVLTT